jgi:hypothetical protein
MTSKGAKILASGCLFSELFGAAPSRGVSANETAITLYIKNLSSLETLFFDVSRGSAGLTLMWVSGGIIGVIGNGTNCPSIRAAPGGALK